MKQIVKKLFQMNWRETVWMRLNFERSNWSLHERSETPSKDFDLKLAMVQWCYSKFFDNSVKATVQTL